MPSSVTPATPAVPDNDPLVYDRPTPATPTPVQPPVLIPLPEVPVGNAQPATSQPPAQPLKPATVTPTAVPDIEDAPTPVPGTPMLAPATPVPAEDASITQLINQATSLLTQGRKLEARTQLSYLIFNRHDDLVESQANLVRSKLKEINDDLIFSKRVIDGDPVATVHVVSAGDYLGPIAQQYHVNYQLLEAINRVKATRIWPGQKLKIIKGPFNVIVDKSDYLMDIFLNDDKGNKVYVATYPIGLGEQDSTPIGMWRVRPNSKVENPSWADPRTGKVFQPDDPANPIGEYWIGIEGMDANTQDKKGYGIHGTTEANSIGQQMSMGCIRMRADDLVWVYMMLVDKDSTVQIRR
jgi:lipoprotein-anchoring transpeptidase ErfK/SrfK